MTRRDGSSQKICAVFVGEDALRGPMIYLVCRLPVLKKGVWQSVWIYLSSQVFLYHHKAFCEPLHNLETGPGFRYIDDKIEYYSKIMRQSDIVY